ncbi:S1 RNA-binding domain-containing protein [Desertimonas flava]|uniref:S1 RNA-binding domain-containing protein n=1 Tax=Desertimonas flava TaxID=2064846 RepID=UPI0013C4AEFA|nr:S1 RNA-binding domain-containing protein [Desertimonas flava]
MTTAQRDGHPLVVVDGSNIATEGRSSPSLAQLNDAVLSFRDEHPESAITVVVDATFGHRIDKSEVKAFDEAVAHNEVVAPPAGAIGRGDAFVLSIAHKVGATILSNDSFQEFHGQYPWLFDEGRLIGGKPVPNIGWVFVNRVPVKGPVSRKARAGANASRRTASKLASQPMPVPKEPPPGRRSRQGEGSGSKRTEPATPKVEQPAPAASRPAPSGGPVNDLLPFLEFVELNPVGSSVSGVVESYSSHGAYVTIGDLRGYVPLRLMADPPPRSAREVLKLGDHVTLVVSSFAPARRSVDLAIPAAAASGDASPAGDPAPTEAPGEEPAAKPAKRAGGRRSAAKRSAGEKPAAPVKKASTRSAAAAEKGRAADREPTSVSTPADVTPREPAPVAEGAAPAKRATRAKKAAAAAPDTPGAATATRKRSANKAVPTEPASAAAAANRPAAKKAAAKKAAAKKAAAKESAGTAPAANKTVATKAAATKKAASTEPAAKKAAAKKTSAKQGAAKTTAAKKPAAKKSAARKTTAAKTVAAAPGQPAS